MFQVLSDTSLLLLLLLRLQMTACMFTFGSAEKVQDFKQLVEQYKPKK